jgi:hypothetical protein
MNRYEAKKLAETVSIEDLQQMFRNAEIKIKDWEKVSRVNKGMTKGTAYNILATNIFEKTSIDQVHILGRTNMILEFGEFLPGYSKQVKKQKQTINPIHQEPRFKI